MTARPQVGLTIAAALALYLDSRIAWGRGIGTIRTQKNQLRRFFGPALGEPLRTLSTERLQQLARSLAMSLNRRTGAPLSSQTLAFCRDTARHFTRWCTAQGHLSADPMACLKQKLSAWLHDEAKQLRADLEALRQERDQLCTAGGAP